MIRYAVLLYVILSSSVAFSQSYTYTYVDPCTKIIKNITIPSGQQNIAVTYYGQVGTFSQSDFANGTFMAWMNATSAINSNKPCDGLVTQTTTQTNLIVTNNIISTLTNITSVATMASQLAGSVANISAGSASSALGNATNNSSAGSSGNSDGNSNNSSNNSGSSSSNGSANGGSSSSGGTTGGSSTGGGNTGGSGSSGSGGGTTGGSSSSGGTAGGSGSGGGNTGGSGGGSGSGSGGGNTGGSGGSGGSGGGTTGGSGGSGGTGTGGGTQGNPPTTTESGQSTASSSGGNGGTTNSVSNAAESSSTSDGGSGGGSGGKGGDKARARVGSLIGTGDLVAIRSAADDEKDQFKFTMSMTHANTKNTFAKGFLGNFTTSINNSNITFYGAWTKKTATLIFANSSMINFEKDFFNTTTTLGSKRLGKLSLMGGANFTIGKLGKTPFTNLSAVGGGFYMFTPGKKKKITGTILLLGVYSPFTQFYEGKWWDSGILVVPFSSWDYSITKKFKFNISFSGTYEWNKNMLNYQVLTGGKILL